MSDLIRCEHCGSEISIASLVGDKMRNPVMPNTLTDLPDYNTVDWLCPKCDVWNLNSDQPKGDAK